MAAVAGSKGRIHVDQPLGPSFQAVVAGAVLGGQLSAEGAAKRIVARARIREVGIDTNMACNLRCKYCYLDDRPVAPAQLSPVDWMDALTPLARDGCKLFAFIGKEPLLDDIAVEVLQRLDSLRDHEQLSFRTGMVTNGTNLDRHAPRIRDANIDYMDISLDGLPEVNDSWRGEGVSANVLAQVERYLGMRPSHDLFIACVLHQGNREHVPAFAGALFKLGVPGFFCSPVLKFTRNDHIAEWAITVEELEETIERLTAVAALHRESHQVIVDLPYKYAWQLLARRVEPKAILEDAVENPVYQPTPAVPLFLKMNLLSFSYWRAVRITHDGAIVADMDMAAHAQYGQYSTGRPFGDAVGLRFHEEFLARHSRGWADASRVYDREIATNAPVGVISQQ